MTILAAPNTTLGISIGGILGGIAGGITGFIGGGPAGAVAGAIAGSGIGGGAARPLLPNGGTRLPGVPPRFPPGHPAFGGPGFGGPARGPCCPAGSFCSGNCINTPIGSACVGGQGCVESIRAPGFGPGAPTTTTVVPVQTQDGKCCGPCATPGGQKGRLKSEVVNGQLVCRCVATRRLNVGNLKAARRARTRLSGAVKELKKIESLVKDIPVTKPRRRAPARSRKGACGCA